MSVIEWKKVELFGLISLSSISMHNIDGDITAHCCNSIKAINGETISTFVLCDSTGNVHIFFGCDKKPKPISFKCCEKLQQIKLCALTANNLLAIVTQDDTNNLSISIYIYDLKKLTIKEGNPCISSTVLSATSMATIIQVSYAEPEKWLALAVGFEKGDILVHLGNINRDLSQNIRRHVAALSAINGIEFVISHQPSNIHMFLTCLEGVFCIGLNDKGLIKSKVVLDNKKNSHNYCCTLSQRNGTESFFVVGRDDAVYCFTRDGRGPCYAIDGQKDFVSWIGHHLVVVVKSLSDSVVIVVDVDNKLIVLHKRIKNFLCIITGNNLYHIITKEEYKKKYSYNIYKFQEHNTTNKVRLLITNFMYENALRILERDETADYENAEYVRLQYGNNLLLKGNSSRAVTEYAQTIGIIKPYDIISKLLSSRHNDNLKQYLKIVLKSEHITTDHTKLFENCCHREDLDFRIQQLWALRNDSTHICDFKNLSDNAINISSLINGGQESQPEETIISVFENTEEHEIINFFLDFGLEILLLHSTTVSKIFKVLVQTRRIKDTLGFLTIFSDHAEFCAILLKDFISNSSTSNEKFNYYLLALYLNLWRDNKISTQTIMEFLKTTRLRFEKCLVICKSYLFNDGIEYLMQSKKDTKLLTSDDAKLHCIQSSINKNPLLAPLLTLSPRSLLIILFKVCCTRGIQISDIKSYFVEKFMKNLDDLKSELYSIEALKNNIKINGSLLSEFKSNSMEFRNSCCDICRQSLQIPSVYFLCQHSFHKDCLRYNYNPSQNGNETVCALCNENHKYCNYSDYKKADAFSKSSDIIKGISNVLGSGIVKLRDPEEFHNMEYSVADQRDLKTNISEFTKNPFDDNYDSNFNCF